MHDYGLYGWKRSEMQPQWQPSQKFLNSLAYLSLERILSGSSVYWSKLLVSPAPFDSGMYSGEIYVGSTKQHFAQNDMY